MEEDFKPCGTQCTSADLPLMRQSKRKNRTPPTAKEYRQQAKECAQQANELYAILQALMELAEEFNKAAEELSGNRLGIKKLYHSRGGAADWGAAILGVSVVVLSPKKGVGSDGARLVDRAMKVRSSFFIAAVFICASITAAIPQEASIYGVFCDTPEQVEIYILEQQQGKSAQDAFEEALKQDKKPNCMNLHVKAVGIHQVGKLHTSLEKKVGVFAVRVVAILPISGGSEPYQRLDDPILVYTPIALR
jgi:hypothetical protein